MVVPTVWTVCGGFDGFAAAVPSAATLAVSRLGRLSPFQPLNPIRPEQTVPWLRSNQTAEKLRLFRGYEAARDA